LAVETPAYFVEPELGQEDFDFLSLRTKEKKTLLFSVLTTKLLFDCQLARTDAFAFQVFTISGFFYRTTNNHMDHECFFTWDNGSDR
jgi:hypothetical protein